MDIQTTQHSPPRYIEPTTNHPSVASQIYGDNSWYTRISETSSVYSNTPDIQTSTIHPYDPKVSFKKVYNGVNSLLAYDTTPLQLTNAIIKAH